MLLPVFTYTFFIDIYLCLDDNCIFVSQLFVAVAVKSSLLVSV